MTLDLTTRYLGLELAHPLVASPSPLARDLDGIRRLEDAGAAAIVLPSIYEEEVEAEDARHLQLFEQGSSAQPEAAGYFPAIHRDVGSLDARLTTLRRAREACAVPIIASLNGVAPTGWVRIAKLVEQAGASALELNLYDVPANLDESGAAVERRWQATVEAVRAAVRVPLAVKLSPWLSSPGHFCRNLAAAGVNGLVLFNRFYQPDIDLDTLRTTPNLQLSSPHEMRQALLWIALLAGHVEASLAATTGRGDRRARRQVPAIGRRRGDDDLRPAATRAAPPRRLAPWPRAMDGEPRLLERARAARAPLRRRHPRSTAALARAIPRDAARRAALVGETRCHLKGRAGLLPM
jgi:dihydroorotate dehydrogenase (fumarate)